VQASFWGGGRSPFQEKEGKKKERKKGKGKKGKR